MLEKFQTYITPILESFGENAIMQASFVIMVAFVIASIFKYFVISGLKRLITRSQVGLGNGFVNWAIKRVVDLKARGPVFFHCIIDIEVNWHVDLDCLFVKS